MEPAAEKPRTGRLRVVLDLGLLATLWIVVWLGFSALLGAPVAQSVVQTAVQTVVGGPQDRAGHEEQARQAQLIVSACLTELKHFRSSVPAAGREQACRCLARSSGQWPDEPSLTFYVLGSRIDPDFPRDETAARAFEPLIAHVSRKLNDSNQAAQTKKLVIGKFRACGLIE